MTTNNDICSFVNNLFVVNGDISLVRYIHKFTYNQWDHCLQNKLGHGVFKVKWNWEIGMCTFIAYTCIKSIVNINSSKNFNSEYALITVDGCLVVEFLLQNCSESFPSSTFINFELTYFMKHINTEMTVHFPYRLIFPLSFGIKILKIDE